MLDLIYQQLGQKAYQQENALAFGEEQGVTKSFHGINGGTGINHHHAQAQQGQNHKKHAVIQFQAAHAPNLSRSKSDLK